MNEILRKALHKGTPLGILLSILFFLAVLLQAIGAEKVTKPSYGEDSARPSAIREDIDEKFTNRESSRPNGHIPPSYYQSSVNNRRSASQDEREDISGGEASAVNNVKASQSGAVDVRHDLATIADRLDGQDRLVGVLDPFLGYRRSLDDWKLEDFFITITIGGTIQASDRNTGDPVWSFDSEPLVNVTNHQRESPSFDSERWEPEKEIEWIIEPGNGGLLYSYQPGIGMSRGNFKSMRYMVHNSGYVLRPSGLIFTGTMRTEMYIMDPTDKTAKFLISSEGPIASDSEKCQRSTSLGGLDDDEECEFRRMSLAKTEYTVIITHPDKGKLWTLRYVEWSTGVHNTDLASQYEQSKDGKYIYTFADGNVMCRDIHKTGNSNIFNRQFPEPVVQVFDVVSSVHDKSLVLLPHPKDPTLSDDESGVRAIDHAEGIGFYARSPLLFSSENTEEGVGNTKSDLQLVPSGPAWLSMDEEGKIKAVKGNQKFIDVVPFSQRVSASEPEMNRSRDPYTSSSHKERPAAMTTSDSRSNPSQNPFLQMTALLILLSAVWFAGRYSDKIAASLRRTRLRVIQDSNMRVETSHHVLDIADDTQMMKEQLPSDLLDLEKEPELVPLKADPEVEVEISEEVKDVMPVELKIEVAQDQKDKEWVQVPIPTGPEIVTPTVRFADLPDDEDNGSDLEEGNDADKQTPNQTPKKQRKRGRRSGKRRNGNKKKDGDGDDKFSNEAQEVAVIHNPEPLLPVPSGMIADDLRVSTDILGHGSHGTVVFKGTFGHREVAVKRLLVDYYDVASHEVNLLQRVDDHPNVVRYYCQKQTESFLYIALELCPASLQEVYDKAEHKQILNLMDPPEVLRQMTLGVQHLHSLKIVHRDLKPQNILVAEPKRSLRDPSQIQHPKILISDFGLCKKLEADQSSFRATTAHAAGTSGWRAPELLIGEGDTSLSSLSEHTNGSTSDSSVLDTLTNRRATRAIDIFSLGCVFFFVLTRGAHPFGDRYLREANIITGKWNLAELDSLGDSGYEAKDLISSMISRNPKLRPDASSVLTHPFFWSAEKKLNFLLDVSDRFEKEERDPPSAKLQLLEQVGPEVFGIDWYKRLDKSLIDNLGKHRKYQGDRMLDLLRALRNKKHHYQDLPPAVQAIVGSLPEGYLCYFTARFPKLLVLMFHLVRDNLQHEAMFRVYFTT